jgi:uncharacterized protein YdhG (YjbR/CyaY superfamily)
MISNPAVIDYLEQQTPEAKEALLQLRSSILDVEPAFSEGLSRGVPFFYFRGKRVAGFRASKTHLSFFIMEGQVLRRRLHSLNESGFDVSSTVIRFNPERPLPLAVLQELVSARVEEIKAAFFANESGIQE